MSSSFSKMTYNGVQYVPLSEAQAAIEWLESRLRDRQNALDHAIDYGHRKDAEIERLKAERDEWRAVCTEDYEPRMVKLQAVVDAAAHLLAGGDKEAVYHLEKALAALENDHE